MASNRERVMRAALEILASGGIRALTHRRIDQHARLPEGSTSNVFRTRGSLLLGVTEYMVATELPVTGDAFQATSVAELTESMHVVFEELVGPLRTQTAARLALFVEAGHDEEIREILARGRAEFSGPLRSAFADLNAPDPGLAVSLLATCFEGLFLQVIGGYANLDPRPIIEATVRVACGAR